MLTTLSLPVFWRIGGNDEIPRHSFGIYVMGYQKERDLYRAGALGLNAKTLPPVGALRTDQDRRIAKRIYECKNWEGNYGKLEACFMFATESDWHPLLGKLEIYLQGEMYKLFTFVGKSHFRCANRQIVRDQAHAAMKRVMCDQTLLSRVVSCNK